MKKTNLLTILVLSASIIFSGCASMSNTGKGAAIGAGGGAALGAGIGALVGKGKGAAIGAAVGGAVGAGTDRELFSWVKEAEGRGAGEILFTSMDHDGTHQGFACEATGQVADLVNIPVIASGGGGLSGRFL